MLTGRIDYATIAGMIQDQPTATGLKPTLRQIMILVVWVALVTAATRWALRYHLLGNDVGLVCMMVPITFGFYPFPLLAGLLWLLDRPGRICRWYMATTMIAASVIGPILYLLGDTLCYVLTGKPTMIFPMGPIMALVGFWCTWKQWQTTGPRLCPECSQRSLIPIAVKPRPTSRRLVTTGRHRWCASCGAEHESRGTPFPG